MEILFFEYKTIRGNFFGGYNPETQVFYEFLRLLLSLLQKVNFYPEKLKTETLKLVKKSQRNC